MEAAKPDALLCVGEQMLGMLEAKAPAEATLMDELSSRVFNLTSICEEDHVELVTWIEDIQKQITAVEDVLQLACARKHEGVPEEVLKRNKYTLIQQEKMLKQEERALQAKLDVLSEHRRTLQVQKECLKKLQTDLQRNQMILSLGASTFHIIPSEEGNKRLVSGNIVDSKGHVIDTFEFDTEGMNAIDLCDKLWTLCITNSE